MKMEEAQGGIKTVGWEKWMNIREDSQDQRDDYVKWVWERMVVGDDGRVALWRG